MRTLAKTSVRPNYLFSLLPWYFKENDSYKDGNGEGFLERYLEIFCAEVDSNIVPFIDNAHLLLDAEALSSLPHSDPDVFLDYLANIFGNPPYMGTDAQYKALIRHIVWILKTKGTRTSVELFVNLLGYTIYDLTEEAFVDGIYDDTPVAGEYDNNLKYDEGIGFYSKWDIFLRDLPGTGVKSPTTEWLTKLKQAIQKFLAPICSTLNQVAYTEVPFLLISNGSIVYRKRALADFYHIDFSADGGATWELSIVSIPSDENNIIITIDSNPAGYRQEVRGSNYYIDHELTPTGFGGLEGTDWETIYSIIQ